MGPGGVHLAPRPGTNLALVNNKHPMVAQSTLRAGYRLVLHGLASEMLHAYLVQKKRVQAQAEHAKAARPRPGS